MGGVLGLVFCSNGEGYGAGGGGGFVRVWGCKVVWGGVRVKYGLARGVDEGCSSSGVAVVCEREHLERFGEEHIGMVAGSYKGWVGAVGVGMIQCP